MYTDIKTFEDACKKFSIEPDSVFVTLPEQMKHHQVALNAHAKLVIAAEAVQDGWKPDWKNWDQRKYFPWFEMGSPSGGGFSYDGCAYWDADSYVGSRLCFETREQAEYFGKQFSHLYEAYMVLKD